MRFLRRFTYLSGMCRLVPCVMVLTLLAAACGGRTQNATLPPPSNEILTTSDGYRIAATLYPAEKPGSPGLVLVHMLGADRSIWEGFARRAQREGYSSLAIDLRGHGDSRGPGDTDLSYKSFDTGEWLKALQDIDAAKSALLKRGNDPENIAIVGASIGANLALRYAVEHADIQAVVMLSPGLDYHGIEIEPDMVAYGKRPSLMLTSTGDSYSASSCSTLKALAPGFCELREYGGAAHGTDILDAEPASVDQVFLWLTHIIGPQAAASNRAGAR
ncbi:MAG: alpha/beta hydrolase [Candidatus Hydrogenedentes bacterium]|nr:alpha/beta hydrolase [Candidatus Hydrogenedentota bacterium]